MRRLLVFVVALALITPTHAAPPTLAAAWQPSGLRVQWQADVRVCLLLERELLTCGASGDVLLARAGVDYAYAPLPGRMLTLVDAGAVSGAALATQTIPPEHSVWLPVAGA